VTPVRRSFPRVRPALAAFATLLACGGASAMTVSYQCIGYRPLTAEFTPQVAQLHFEGNNWTLKRVRDAKEATYIDGRHGVKVVTKQREMTLSTEKETLACKLQSDALRPEALGVAPKAPPSAPHAGSGGQ
jgi:hypothetical protein